jgi:hypothetical protein
VQIDTEDQATPVELFGDLLAVPSVVTASAPPATTALTVATGSAQIPGRAHEARVVHGDDDRPPIGPEDPPHAVRLSYA